MSLFELILLVLVAAMGGGMFYMNKKSVGQKSSEEPSQATKVSQPAVLADQNLAARQVIADSQTQAKEIVLEAKDEALKIKKLAEDEARKIRQEGMELEKSLDMRQGELNAKINEIDRREQELNAKTSKVDSKISDLDKVYRDQVDKLEKIAGLTRDEAKKDLMVSLERELSSEVAKKVREAEEKVKQESQNKAKEILVDAMRHASTDYVVEYTVSKVKLPDDEIKGRIIGKEGRNIRVFEELTGTNLDMDESVSEVRVSSFDPIRREVAKVSLERLIADGRIQPAKIEEIIELTKKDIDRIILKEGEDLCHKVGVYNLPKELVQMLGKFKYRFSYGQNMIQHTLEETKLGVQLASELGVDVNIVKMGCLFHDIGKIVTDEEGTHVQLGADLLRKFKIPDAVVNCVAEHHEDKPFSSLESVVVHIADSISGARPGARSEDYEAYVKRMKDLEQAALSFDGVDKVYAISAGREVRVFVKPERVDDTSCALLAREVAKKIELEQTYPGTVKVTVIRETRVSDTAK